MSMADDWKRLADLDAKKGGVQYGQYLDVFPSASNPDLVLVSKDLVRLEGEKTDVNAWRIYLGPWQPRAGIVTEPLIATAEYADPTPWAPPQPRSFDSLVDFPCYARVLWGSGGFQHYAYIDWPRRGCLFQVSGSYVQVNAFINTMGSGPALTTQLPILHATIGPEPGGGDVASPGTFTYPIAAMQLDAGPPALSFQNFQIPPFARAFVPIMRYSEIAAGMGTVNIATQRLPLAISASLTNCIQTWVTPLSGVYDPDFVRDAFPISGQNAGTVRIETDLIPPGNAGEIGCMFLLDL
ncbi:MAG: hypothetical protein AB7O21_19580 [Gammaproteobacteria bacterium]